MQKNDMRFILLSISSDLRNISTAMMKQNQTQATTFFNHAKALTKGVGDEIDIFERMNSTIPKARVSRIKKADKFLTWSIILQGRAS